VIDGGSPQAPEVTDGNVLQAAKLLSTDDIMKTLQQNNENLLSITTNFKLLSRKILQGKGTVGTLMTDSTMAVQLKASIGNLQAATASAAQMAVSLNKFSARLNTKGGFVDKVFTDTSTFPITGNLAKASNKLNSSDNAIGVLLNDPASAAKLKSTIDNLQQSSVNLNLDLEAAQHNFLLKGFFKDRAKAKADSLKKANP
jgi:phospholipid/cholesterol/gamma-HCH transport system substrate-binding protein